MVITSVEVTSGAGSGEVAVPPLLHEARRRAGGSQRTQRLNSFNRYGIGSLRKKEKRSRRSVSADAEA
jgi:hypothetical protein